MKKVPKEVKLIQEHKRQSIKRDEKNISYSQFLSYSTCPHQWYLNYVRNLAVYQPSIHTVFGTSMHETIQKWLEVMYQEGVKQAMEMDLYSLLEERMYAVYRQEKAKSGHEHFSTSEQLQEFFEDGKLILDFLKKKRSEYFSTKNNYLVGVEVPLVLPVKKGLYFKGYIDLVFYNEVGDIYTIIDIKTSTSGWNDEAKKDEKKITQLILYKQYFAEQFKVDVEKVFVEYIILKRKVPIEPEFASMGKRIQSFVPSSGRIKRAYVTKKLNEFVNECFDDNGQYVEKEYLKNASKSNCRFCPFNENKFLCNQPGL
jgi:CRISPR/Cas system-associated exonuclease Cas4 (RecB family)